MKKQVVNEWFERGERDFEVAKFLLSEEKYSDVVLFHIHQAIEKYLKGFLIYKGWKLKKIHDIEVLITETINFKKEFQKYLNFSRKLTAFYIEERYPPGPISSFSKDEIKEILEISEEIINKLKEEIK
jgi:HEPN domain-containing protein